ncbi:hypothetical protein FRB96_000809 [Tulasnella sp. 330]|nr:hypothetical protein FRB96_000809 [Tulasnella sp. 330]
MPIGFHSLPDRSELAWATLHDYCRSNKIPIQKTDLQIGTPEAPSFVIGLNVNGITYVGAPAPNKKAALRLAAIQAAGALGLIVPEN